MHTRSGKRARGPSGHTTCNSADPMSMVQPATWVWSAAAAVVLLAFASPVHAQSAAAEALFERGNKLMADGKLAEACDAFAGSNRIEPRAGTLLWLGECRERNHQLASAWSAFKDALTRATDTRKRELAAAKLKELEGRLSYLTISVADASRVDGLVITRDGVPVDPALWNVAIPVDGGEYVIAGSAPGNQEWKATVVVPAENGAKQVEVPRLKDLRRLTLPPPGRPVAAVAVRREEPAAPVSAPRRWLTRRRELALGAAGLGVIAAGAGIALGLSADAKQSDAEKLCPSTTCTDAPRANQLIQDGRSRALDANIAFAVAGAAIVGGGILWLTGGPEQERGVAVVPTASRREAGLALVGRF